MYASNFAQDQLDHLMNLYKKFEEGSAQTKDDLIDAYNDFNDQRYIKLA